MKNTDGETALPNRQVRAHFSVSTVRVYQAFSAAIADEAVAAQTFRPPFKRDRMTWIKPSFTWMMYRCGWALKEGQERVLGIDISREGFEWALAHSCPASFDREVHASPEQWRAALAAPVRIQWDPERDLNLSALPWRTIQIGLGGDAVRRYVDEWIVGIEDLTVLTKRVHEAVVHGGVDVARRMLRDEREYPITADLARVLGCEPASAARGASES